MAIVVGTNSWVTIAEADAYLTNKLGTQDWFTLVDTAGPGEESKELLLVMAFDILVNKPGYDVPATLTDDYVKFAQIEMAYYLKNNYEAFLAQGDVLTRGVTSFTMSKWSETYSTATSWLGDFPLPVMVTKWLAGYQRLNITVNMKVE